MDQEEIIPDDDKLKFRKKREDASSEDSGHHNL